jgi:hypothetical protein
MLLLMLLRVESRELRWAEHLTEIHAATSGITVVY